MRHWLIKSEGAVYSIDRLRADRTTGWDGVRNYQARNFMKEMKVGDLAFFYHSNSEPSGIAGIAEVSHEAYPDPTQFDRKDVHYDPKARPDAPTWVQVDVRFKRAFPRVIALDELRSMQELKGMALFTRARLSVQPVTPDQWAAILRRAG